MAKDKDSRSASEMSRDLIENFNIFRKSDLGFSDRFSMDLPSYEMPPPPGQAIVDHAKYSQTAASSTVKMLMQRIRAVEASLAPDEQIMFCLVGGPSGVTFLPRSIVAADPDKIVFEGMDGDHPFLLVQHVSQLNFAIRVTGKPAEVTRNPIGFSINAK